MKFFQNKRVAVTAMLLMIAVSVLFGGWRTLNSWRSKAEKVFYLGEDGNNIGMQSDLNARMELSFNLTTVCARALGEDDPAVRQVLDARDALGKAESIHEKYLADRSLTDAVHALYEKTEGLELSERDEHYRHSLYADLKSRAGTMSHDIYNTEAAEFNAKLGKMPASFFAKLTGIRPLDIFS